MSRRSGAAEAVQGANRRGPADIAAANWVHVSGLQRAWCPSRRSASKGRVGLVGGDELSRSTDWYGLCLGLAITVVGMIFFVDGLHQALDSMSCEVHVE